MSRLYSISQIAKGGEFETIPVHKVTLYKLAESGDLETVRIGRRMLVSTEGLEGYLKKVAGGHE